MSNSLYFAYRCYGDVYIQSRSIEEDPGTGDNYHIHPAGDMISFDSEETRDEYVNKGVVSTTLPDGTHLKHHVVHAITTEDALELQERCASSKGCIHKAHTSMGTKRIPAE